MNKQIQVVFSRKTILLGAEYSKKASVAGSPEYLAVKSVREDYPDYTIEVRKIKKPARKESYKGLHYPYMEQYIALNDPDGSIRKEYDKLRLLAECHSIRFPFIKSWFLATYPEVRKYGVLEIPEDEAAARALDMAEKKTTVQRTVAA